MLGNWQWCAPNDWIKIKTIDLHTGGEPLRVLIDGLPTIKGSTILEKRRFFRDNLDYIRRGLIFEPRGHADMYGAVITEAISDDADFGTFFMHNDGYSTMCGHAIIALTKLVLDTKMIEKQEKDPIVVIDAPPGKIVAQAYRSNGVVEKVSFLNVPSFIVHENQCVEVEEIGKLNFDIAFGGAYYAYVDTKQLDLSLEPKDYSKIINYGRLIKSAVMKNYSITHPYEDDLSFLYGVIFIGDSLSDNHSRNVCVFADGEVDRSATGSGVSGRAAIHFAKGEIGVNEVISIESILGTTMTVEVVEERCYGEYKAIIPRVTGKAHIIGQNEFCFDPKDKLNEGFIFR